MAIEHTNNAPDSSFRGGLSPEAIVQAYQKKYASDIATQQTQQQQQTQAWEQVAQATGKAISTGIQNSKNKQKQDLIKSWADSLATSQAVVPNENQATVSFKQPLPPGQIGPQNQVTKTVPIASFNPTQSDQTRAFLQAFPEQAAQQYAKTAFQDPNDTLVKVQTRLANLQAKQLSNQAKQNLVGAVPDTVKTMLKAQGIDIPDGMTVADLKTALPGVSAGVRAGVLGELAKARGDQVTAKMSEDMGNDLNPAKFKTGTPEGQAAQRLFASKDAKALFDQIRTQQDGPDRRQALEAALATVRTLVGGNNGQISEKMVAEMVPPSARKQFANWEEYFKNAPVGSQQQAFMDRLETTIDRVSGINQDVVNDSIRQNLSKYKVLHKRDPEAWTASIEAAGLDPNDVVNDVYKPGSIRRLRNTSLGRQTVNKNNVDLGGGFSYSVIGQ